MNNSFSLQQIQKTSNLDANLISRQFKLNLIADLMRLKYENPKMKQSEIANQLRLSSSTIQRYRNDINMLLPYRINPNRNHKRPEKIKISDFDNDSHHEADAKRLQMTSNDLKTTSNEPVQNIKNKLKGGSNIEIDEHCLDKNLKNNDS